LLDAHDAATVELLRTLQTFFDSDRNVRRSARKLGVHENTVRYRLVRIEELTGLSIASSSEDQQTAQLALLILRLDGQHDLADRSAVLEQPQGGGDGDDREAVSDARP
jgi:DNA-binding PucR family transcriptional regulator